ncbi:MAG: hypothetical protein ACMG6E_02210 [Candidatus Roizmanbacteria bacterium]
MMSLFLSTLKVMSTDRDPSELAKEEQLTAAVVKNCPFCEKQTYKIDGCNYMKCSNSDPPSNCPGEWCFVDGLPKYKPIPSKPYLAYCVDLSHNSH